jgi:hypothetical protein
MNTCELPRISPIGRRERAKFLSVRARRDSTKFLESEVWSEDGFAAFFKLTAISRPGHGAPTWAELEAKLNIKITLLGDGRIEVIYF